MQAHGIAPFLRGLCVAIVTRVVLFFGVQPVPVNSVPRVCVPLANKVLSTRGGPSKSVISCLLGWLCGTGRQTSTPVEEVIMIVELS